MSSRHSLRTSPERNPYTESNRRMAWSLIDAVSSPLVFWRIRPTVFHVGPNGSPSWRVGSAVPKG